MKQTFAESRFWKGACAAPDRIIVATDLTDSDYLVPHAIAQAKASSAHVTLVHAIIPSDSVPIDTGAVPYVDWEKIDRDVHFMLLGIARQIESQGISCDVYTEHGFAADVIREKIRSSGATRLIMGTHGRGKFAQIALGSVANELLRSVEVPVFAVGPYARGLGEHDTPRKILYPVSLFGDEAGHVGFAIDLAQTYRAELTLLYVLDREVEAGMNCERTLAWAENALAALAPNGADLVPPVHTSAIAGDLVEEILNAATRTNADWIVLGVDGAYPFWPFRDTTAYKVAAAAKCPVLTIRHAAHRVERAKMEEYRPAAVIG
jgi:nucleotide-binding universal stress UspA family protein